MLVKFGMNKTITFNKDFHPEFDGYLSEQGTGVFISFIQSKQEGKGNFLRLLSELKEKYEWIKIPTPSTRMCMITLRKRFKLKNEYFKEPFNEWGKMLVWKKKYRKEDLEEIRRGN